MNGLPASSTIALGIFSVIGLRRVASPPARSAAGTVAMSGATEAIRPENVAGGGRRDNRLSARDVSEARLHPNRRKCHPKVLRGTSRRSTRGLSEYFGMTMLGTGNQ